MVESGECDTQEESERLARRNAQESAECGLTRSIDCRRVVFEIEISEDEFNSLFQDDNSCQNMDYAVVSTEIIPSKFITRYWIDENSLDFFRCYFAGIQMKNDLKIELELTNAEKLMAKAVYESDNLWTIAESLSEIELQEVELQQLIIA